jgi:hypothetical protein
MKLHLAKAEAWAKNLFKGFTGAKILGGSDFWFDYEHQGSHSNNFFNATGIKGTFSFQTNFYAYYCYDNKDPIHTEDESGSFINVVFNNLFLTPLCFDEGIHTIGGKPMFRILEKDHSKGRIDFYDYRVTANVNDTIYTSKQEVILIRNSDKPVFVTVNRKEFLEQMLIDIESYRAKQKEIINQIYEAQEKQFANEISVYKTHDKTFTAEKEALKRKKFQETHNPEKLEKDLKKIDAEVNASGETIRQYLKSPQQWLDRGISHFYPNSTFTPAGLKQFFDGLDTYYKESKNELTRTEVVYINPAYFNKSMAADVPQLIIVHLAKGSYAHMLKVSRLVHQEGVLAPLEVMLAPVK